MENLFFNFNKVIVYIDVPFNRKDEAKKYGARWSPDTKSWYFNHRIEEDVRNYDDSLIIITKFKVTDIEHKYYDQDDPNFQEIVKYFNESKKATRNKIINCECGCNYKYKREDEHLQSVEHPINLKIQNTLVTCECGCKYRLKYKNYHLKEDEHINFLRELGEGEGNI